MFYPKNLSIEDHSALAVAARAFSKADAEPEEPRKPEKAFVIRPQGVPGRSADRPRRVGRRTAEKGSRRSLALLSLRATVLGAIFLGAALAGPAAALTPQFVSDINPFGLAGVGEGAAPAFADIDGDGDLDAFIGGANGNTRFFENTGTPSSPIFAASIQNPLGLADVGSFAAPAFADIDGDGDLDALIGNNAGDTQLFENMGTPSAPAFAPPITNPHGLANLPLNASPAVVDIDADGDLDVFISNSRGETWFFENGGTANAPAFRSPIQTPFGLPLVESEGAAAFVDLDGDGDLDAFIGNGPGDTSFAENTGTASAPAFDPPVTNAYGLADSGYNAAPAFADLDGDGDLDAFIGNSAGNTILFENTGTSSAPSFPPSFPNPFGIAGVFSEASPALGDIDGDGDLDAFVGQRDGNTVFFENTGTAFAPLFAPSILNPFGLADVGNEALPALADIDGDGDLDAFIGQREGNTRFFENTGTPFAPTFGPSTTNPFGLADVGNEAAPNFADIDGDGDLDAFIGQRGGDTRFFENRGTASAPAFAAAGRNPFGLANIGADAVPALADVDGDGDLDAFIGQRGGDTRFFENTGTAFVPAFAASVANPFGLQKVGIQVAPTLADIDGDGDLDAFMGQNDGNTIFFENVGGHVCPSTPTPTCVFGFGKGVLNLKENRPGREKLRAAFQKGPALTQADLGDPLDAGGTAWALCLYGEGGALAGGLVVNRAGEICGKRACWKSIGGAPPAGKGFKYRDKVGRSAGVRSVVLKAGREGRTVLNLKAANNDAKGQLALPTGISDALGSSTLVEMHLVSSNGTCAATTLSRIVKLPSFLRAER